MGEEETNRGFGVGIVTVTIGTRGLTKRPKIKCLVSFEKPYFLHFPHILRGFLRNIFKIQIISIIPFLYIPKICLSENHVWTFLRTPCISNSHTSATVEVGKKIKTWHTRQL